MNVSQTDSSLWLQMLYQNNAANGQSQPAGSPDNGSNSVTDTVTISLQAQLLQWEGQTSDGVGQNAGTGTNPPSPGATPVAGTNPVAAPGADTASTGAAQTHHHHHHHGGGQGSASGSGQNSLQGIAGELLAALGQGTQSNQAGSGQTTDTDGDGDGSSSFIQQLAQGISQDLMTALGLGTPSTQSGQNAGSSAGNSTQTTKVTG